MAFKSLYRKYRPTLFSEIFGQEEIKKVIKNSLENKSFSHAYLFFGPRGTGKTTMAKIFSAAINCLNLQDKEPCLKCEICRLIANNIFPDIIEIDAASNNGVQEIRVLKNNAQNLPFKGRKKIYIIDEVHMLSISAFNALLKILEEPPEHVVFILATTEYNKIPVTVISRCQQFSFKKIKIPLIEENLKYVLKHEGIEYEELALRQIALIANGIMRDSLSVLEQVIMFCSSDLVKRKIYADQIYKIFPIIDTKTKIKFLKKLVLNDQDYVFSKINEFYDQGIDFKKTITDFIFIIKEYLEYFFTKNKKFLNELDEKLIFEINTWFNDKKAYKIMDVLVEAANQIHQNKNDDFYFELAVLKILENTESPLPKLEHKVLNKLETKGDKIVTDKAKPENISSNVLNIDDLANYRAGRLRKAFSKNFTNIINDKNLALSIGISHEGKDIREEKQKIFTSYFLNNENFKKEELFKTICFYGLKIGVSFKNYLIIFVDTKQEKNWIYSNLALKNIRSKLFNQFKEEPIILILDQNEKRWLEDNYRLHKNNNSLDNIGTPTITSLDFYKQLEDKYHIDTSTFSKGKSIFTNYHIDE